MMNLRPSACFPDLARFPDAVSTECEGKGSASSLRPTRPDHWDNGEVCVVLEKDSPGSLSVWVESPQAAVRQVRLRWDGPIAPGTLLLGDAWERSYGDLEWRGVTLPRIMPWYFLVTDGAHTAGYGVATGASSMASWQVDPKGVTLCLDTRSGGRGVQLGSRRLNAATILHRPPVEGESPFPAAQAFCRSLCPKPRLPGEPVVGHNDWYWLYGKNSEPLILDATARFLDLYPSASPVRPWSVIDDGWQTGWAADFNGGPWDGGNERFPGMAGLASKIKALGARPGIWMRPLLTRKDVPESWRIGRPSSPGDGPIAPLDPSLPEVLDLVRTDIARLRDWGYELIKHDFSTFDVTGRWGPEMMASGMGFAPDGWHFADPTRTTAEILVAFYRAIREAAGDATLVMGCNTVGHLAAGLIEIQRTGDDTSASDWDRTRRMGVNTLAFRAPHQDAFYAVDADCVPVSPLIPWRQTSAWLTLVARSGTPLFLSLDPAAVGPEQKEAIRTALAYAAHPAPTAVPLDWLESPMPSRWKVSGSPIEETLSLDFRPSACF